MPELEKEENQEEFGWENLAAHDDGSRDMGDVLPPKSEDPEPPAPPPAETVEKPLETPPEPAEPTVPVTEEPPVAGAAEAQVAEGETPPEDEVIYTLPGGVKVTKAELIADDKKLQDLVTHSNQLTHFQKLSEERETARLQAEAEKREVLDRYTAAQMAQQQQQAADMPAPERPPGKAIEAHFEPALAAMVADGRLTEDHKSEFGGLIAEHMYDMQTVKNLVAEVVRVGGQELGTLQQQLAGEVVPHVQDFQDQTLRATERQIQQEAATIPGYEALAKPEEWQRLVSFVHEKIQLGGFDANGAPIFNPNLDPTTAAQMYDAMTGAELRQQLLAQKALEEQQGKDAQVAAQVTGEGASRAGGPPVVKQPSELTPQEEAMDFTDPAMMTG